MCWLSMLTSTVYLSCQKNNYSNIFSQVLSLGLYFPILVRSMLRASPVVPRLSAMWDARLLMYVPLLQVQLRWAMVNLSSGEPDFDILSHAGLTSLLLKSLPSAFLRSVTGGIESIFWRANSTNSARLIATTSVSLMS